MKNINSFCCLSALALAWACSFAQAATRTSSQTGNWSSTSTWGGSAVPGSADLAVIANGHTVTYDVTSSTVAGVTVNAGGTLQFDTANTRTLQSTKNVEIQGTLKMRPASASVVQTLRFTGINEGNFGTDGGNVVEVNDIGLWVMGAGKLDIVGTSKTAWARASGSIASTAVNVTLGTTPSGWANNDTIVITPTAAPIVDADEKLLNKDLYEGFDEKMLTSVSGATVGWSGGLGRAHPMVNGQWTAEVLNLTRNVRIEGELGKRSHIFIKTTSNTVQTLSYAALRYMGPQKNGQGVLGRYGIHMHECFDTSRGSVFTGTVIYEGGNHAFVPHMTNGVTFTNCIAYNTAMDAYFWDKDGTESLDNVFDGCVAAKQVETSGGSNTIAGFKLEKGPGNVIKNCVAVGNHDNGSASGFEWPAGGAQVWEFELNNISHNNRTLGIFAWQNSDNDHVLENFACYHNGTFGVEHGAYRNHYIYRNATFYGNGKAAMELQALSKTSPITFENVIFDAAGISKSAVITPTGHVADGEGIRIIFRGCTFRGHTKQGLLFQSEKVGKEDLIDLVCCTIDANEFWISSNAASTTSIRVQPNNTTAYELKKASSSGGDLIEAWNAKKYTISPFTTCP